MGFKILIIDNYDSFTYNLFHYIEELNKGNIEVMRNDEIEFNRIEEFDAFIISPGPGLPEQAGHLMLFLERYAALKKILGICLGQQAIAQHFGMGLNNLAAVVHGQSHQIKVTQPRDVLFKGLPESFKVGRYHSWVIDKLSLTKEFAVTAETLEGEIMAISHQSLPIHAVQFHPESILTENGKAMISNWLNSI